MTLYAVQWLGLIALIGGLFLVSLAIGWITAHYSSRVEVDELTGALRYVRDQLRHRPDQRSLVRYLDRVLGEEREA